MTLSVKALTQQRRRAPNERRCATSGTIYDETTGKPIGQRAPFRMWRRFPHRVHTHLYKPAIHSHLPDPFPTEKYQVVPRDSLACDAGCWSKSDISKNCYLNGSTQEYTKDTCENSATMKKCGLGVDVAGSCGRNLNIGTTRHNGPVLPRTNRAFLLQPAPIVKSGIVLRGPGSCETTQQMFQQDGIDYERGGRCNVPGRVVPIENTAAAVRVYEMYLPNKQTALSPALAYADDRLYIVANDNLYSSDDVTGFTMPTYTTISADLGTDMLGFDGTTTSISYNVQGAIAANPYGINPTT